MAPGGLETLQFSAPSQGSGAQAVRRALNGLRGGCRGWAALEASTQEASTLFTKLPAPPTLPQGTGAGGPTALLPSPSLKPGPGLCHGLLPGLPTFNHLTPPIHPVPGKDHSL